MTDQEWIDRIKDRVAQPQVTRNREIIRCMGDTVRRHPERYSMRIVKNKSELTLWFVEHDDNTLFPDFVQALILTK